MLGSPDVFNPQMGSKQISLTCLGGGVPVFSGENRKASILLVIFLKGTSFNVVLKVHLEQELNEK